MLRSAALNDERFVDPVLRMGHDTVKVSRLDQPTHALVRLGPRWRLTRRHRERSNDFAGRSPAATPRGSTQPAGTRRAAQAQTRRSQRPGHPTSRTQTMSLSILPLASTMMAGPPNHVGGRGPRDGLARAVGGESASRAKSDSQPFTRPRVEAAHRIDAALPTLSPST